MGHRGWPRKLKALLLPEAENERMRGVCEAYGGEKIQVTRYFVAADVVEGAGERLLVLSPFCLSLALAESVLQNLLPDYPDACIRSDTVTLDTADWRGAQRLVRYTDQALAEQRKLIQ